jgi:hypothetical protein
VSLRNSIGALLLLGCAAFGCAGDAPGARQGSSGGAANDAGREETGGSHGGAAGATGGGTPSDAGTDACVPGDEADDGGFLGDPRCAAAAVAICDDFEAPPVGGPPDAPLWRVITSYADPQMNAANSVVVDAMHAARGRQALHVHTMTSDPVYIQSTTLPAVNDVFWGRVLAWFNVDPGAVTKGHWAAFVGVGKKGDAGQDTEVRIGGQFDILTINYFGNDANQISSSKDGDYSDGVKLPLQAWTCFEFQYKGDTHELRFFIDGKEVEQLHVTDWGQFGHAPITSWSPSYDRLRIGYQSFNADTPVDVWYDSVAIDPDRIGCQK